MGEPREDFPKFAMNVYRRDGVSEATILLQDRGGVDVNVLLLAAFMGAQRGRSFGPRDVRAALDRVEQWQREGSASALQHRASGERLAGEEHGG
jgi:uncharacterized protein (TIGR02444 family)